MSIYTASVTFKIIAMFGISINMKFDGKFNLDGNPKQEALVIKITHCVSKTQGCRDLWIENVLYVTIQCFYI